MLLLYCFTALLHLTYKCKDQTQPELYCTAVSIGTNCCFLKYTCFPKSQTQKCQNAKGHSKKYHFRSNDHVFPFLIKMNYFGDNLFFYSGLILKSSCHRFRMRQGFVWRWNYNVALHCQLHFSWYQEESSLYFRHKIQGTWSKCEFFQILPILRLMSSLISKNVLKKVQQNRDRI